MRRVTSRVEKSGPLVERAPRIGMPGEERLDELPEPRRMVELDEMRDFVRDHVTREERRQLHQSPVEPDHALLIAASPFGASVGELECGSRGGDARRELRDAWRKVAQRFLAQPFADER